MKSKPLGKRQQKKLVKARAKALAIMNKIGPMPNSFTEDAETKINKYAEKVKKTIVAEMAEDIKEIKVLVNPATYTPPFQVEFNITYVAESTT